MQSNTFRMSGEYLLHCYNEIRSLGIGFRRTRQGQLGSYVEFILVSSVSISKTVHKSALTFSYDCIDGQKIVLVPSPFRSACCKFQKEFECLNTSSKFFSWCSLLEEFRKYVALTSKMFITWIHGLKRKKAKDLPLQSVAPVMLFQTEKSSDAVHFMWTNRTSFSFVPIKILVRGRAEAAMSHSDYFENFIEISNSFQHQHQVFKHSTENFGKLNCKDIIITM